MICILLALTTSQTVIDGTPLRSTEPAYELTLPSDYRQASAEEAPARYVRSRGRESWALVGLKFSPGSKPLEQNLSGVKVEDFLPCVPLPPDAKWTFAPMRWKDFDVGSFEYRAVVKNMPVLGLAVVLPLANGYVTVMVYAPEPLEKECREEFALILSRITKAPTNWHPFDYYQKVETFNRVGMAGAALLLLYPIVWAIAFRGYPMKCHWLRTGWLVAAGVLLFVPIHSPGEMSLLCNLLVNAVLPAVLLLFAARRIKLAVDD